MIHLLTDAAGHTDDITGFVVDHNDTGIQLLKTVGIGNLSQVGVNLINLILHLHVKGSIDMKAALTNQTLIVRAQGLTCCAGSIPVIACTFTKRLRNFFQNNVNKPGVNFLRCITADGNDLIALRANMTVIFGGEIGADLAPVIAILVGAVGILILFVDAALQSQIFTVDQSLSVLFVGKPTVLAHHIKRIFTTALITLHTIELFALVVIKAFTIGIKKRGVIGNTDQRRTFSSIQIVQFLAEILSSCRFDALAAVAQIDFIEIPFNNKFFRIALFKFCCAENFLNFSLNRNVIGFLIVLQHQVLNQLLRNGGTAEFTCTADKHVDTRFDGRNPVNALMFKEAVIFDCNCCIYQGLRNLIVGDPIRVDIGVQALQNLDVALGVDIIHIRVAGLVKVFHDQFGIRKHIRFQIVSKNADKGKQTDCGNRQNSCQRRKNDLNNRINSNPAAVQHLQSGTGLP